MCGLYAKTMQSARAYVARLRTKLRYLTGVPVLKFAFERQRTPENVPPPPVKT